MERSIDETNLAEGRAGVLLKILLAMAASVLLYALLFGALMQKPLSVGGIRDYFELKLARAASLPSPKLIFLGGSNVRIGLRCEVAEAELALPCVNAGFIADVGMDVMAEKFSPLLKHGDYVYIPMAYEQYLATRRFIETQRDAAYLFRYDRETLMKLPMSRRLHALFYFDVPYIASSVTETLMAQQIKRWHNRNNRQYGVNNLNAWGDETGHTAEAGQRHAAKVASMEARPLDVAAFEPEKYESTRQLESFLAWAAESGVTVIGGLPQTIDEIEIPDAIVERIRSLFLKHGQKFVELPNRSQYPRECFFDNFYHLNETCQIQHTRELVAVLRPLVTEARQAR